MCRSRLSSIFSCLLVFGYSYPIYAQTLEGTTIRRDTTLKLMTNVVEEKSKKYEVGVVPIHDKSPQGLIPQDNFPSLSSTQIRDVNLGGNYSLMLKGGRTFFSDKFSVRGDMRNLSLTSDISKHLSIGGKITLGKMPSVYHPNWATLTASSLQIGIKPTEYSLLGLSATYEQFVGYRAWRPEVQLRFYSADRWRLSLNTGLALYDMQMSSIRGKDYYLGGRIDYALNEQWYLFGQGYVSTLGMGGLGYAPPFLHQWRNSLGGGVGFQIPNAGPVEVGVVYTYNPITRRMEPSVSVNIAGALMYLFKRIGHLTED